MTSQAPTRITGGLERIRLMPERLYAGVRRCPVAAGTGSGELIEYLGVPPG